MGRKTFVQKQNYQFPSTLKISNSPSLFINDKKFEQGLKKSKKKIIIIQVLKTIRANTKIIFVHSYRALKKLCKDKIAQPLSPQKVYMEVTQSSRGQKRLKIVFAEVKY